MFPVLIKLIDAARPLSVQVHPDDAYAQRVEGEPGKTEMWYVVDAQPGAQLYYGFQRELTREEAARRIADGTLTDVLNAVPVKAGDVFFIDAGTVHAIGAGILIAEIQQNSNTTYRVFDYGRLGADGKPRALHVEKALDVARLCPPERPAGPMGKPEQNGDCTSTLLAKCGYFTARLLDVAGSAPAVRGRRELPFPAVPVRQRRSHLRRRGRAFCQGRQPVPSRRLGRVYHRGPRTACFDSPVIKRLFTPYKTITRGSVCTGPRGGCGPHAKAPRTAGLFSQNRTGRNL